MKQEPVAWMRRLDGAIIRITPDKIREDDEPLYTTPQLKELSDEEIEEVFLLNCNLINETFAYRDFARAILKKAREHE